MSVKKEAAIAEVSRKYKKYLCTLIKQGKESNLLELFKDDSSSDCSTLTIMDYARENLQMEHRFIINVHLCLSLLKRQEKEIIWKEFFLNQSRSYGNNWWAYHYSRSTYYRLRTKAINDFYGLCCQ